MICINLFIKVYMTITLHGSKWWVGRVGNCPPMFWQNSNAAAAAALYRESYYFPTRL